MSDLGLQANWRKNRRRNAGGSYGVDLNRNYPFGWSFTCGGSTTETSSNYRGTQAASEPEVRTMIAFQVCVACTPPRSVPPSYHPRTILVPPHTILAPPRTTTHHHAPLYHTDRPRCAVA